MQYIKPFVVVLAIHYLILSLAHLRSLEAFFHTKEIRTHTSRPFHLFAVVRLWNAEKMLSPLAWPFSGWRHLMKIHVQTQSLDFVVKVSSIYKCCLNFSRTLNYACFHVYIHVPTWSMCSFSWVLKKKEQLSANWVEVVENGSAES